MTCPPPRIFPALSRWDMTHALTRLECLVCVPVPLGAVGEHSAQMKEGS